MSFTNLWGGSFTPFQTAGNWLGNKFNEGNEYLANQQNQPVDYRGPQDVDYTGGNPSWATQNQTIGQTNLTEDEVNSPDSLLEAAANESEFDNSNNEVSSDGTTSETSDGTVSQNVLDANQKMTNSNRPFRNLFQKMKQGMSKFDKGNIGSAKWEENEFMLDEEGNPLKDEAGNLTINENFGKMTDKGKGLFGKEGGFMSKFGTGKGAMAGLMGGLAGGLGAGLSGMGGGGGTQAPSEYMYKNPWEGVQ